METRRASSKGKAESEGARVMFFTLRSPRLGLERSVTERTNRGMNLGGGPRARLG